MFDLMQRHRRLIMILVLIFAGVPMALFFGVGNPFGGGPSGADMSRAVIEVYDQPVDAATFLNRYAQLTDQLRASGQPVPTARELVLNETVDQMIRGLMSDALLTYEVRNRPYRPTQDYLEERLKEYPSFRDAEGNFNSRYFNQWVTAQQNAGLNWNAIWDMVAEQAKRDLYVQLLTGSARILDSELREEFEHENTRIKVRYLHVEPPIEVSDEAIRQYYDEHPERYQTEPQVSAVVVGISSQAAKPALVDEIIEKARAGADFGELAQQHSKAASRVEGGSLGWVTDSETLPEFRRRIFDLEAGEVSEPVEGPLGYYIYKVEEKRSDEATGVEEVHAREIVIPSRLEPEEQAARQQRAQDLIQAAQDQGLRAAAEAAGLSATAIGPFDRSTLELENIPPADTARLRMALAQEGIGVVSEPLPATKNIYVAEVTEIQPATQMTFEEAREQVVEDWTAEYRATPEFAEQLTTYLSEIQANVDNFGSLEQIREAYPELTTEVEATRLFGRSDMLFDHGWFVDPGAVHTAFEGREPGAIAGPVRDFRNQYYFVELVERQEPTEEMWETEWPEERERLRQMALTGIRNERLEDYLQHRLEKATADAQVYLDSDAMFSLLGVDPNAPPADGDSLLLAPDSPIPAAEPEVAPNVIPEPGVPVEEEGPFQDGENE